MFRSFVHLSVIPLPKKLSAVKECFFVSIYHYCEFYVVKILYCGSPSLKLRNIWNNVHNSWKHKTKVWSFKDVLMQQMLCSEMTNKCIQQTTTWIFGWDWGFFIFLLFWKEKKMCFVFFGGGGVLGGGLWFHCYTMVLFWSFYMLREEWSHVAVVTKQNTTSAKKKKKLCQFCFFFLIKVVQHEATKDPLSWFFSKCIWKI